jgi:thioredoxin-related protein
LFLSPVTVARDFTDAEVSHVAHPDWFVNDPFVDLETIRVEAQTEGRQGIMVLFTTQGCSYCDAFVRRSLGNPQLASRLRAQFASVGLEVFDDTEMTSPSGQQLPIKQFAETEGAEYTPTLLFYGDDGTRILRVVGYQSPERFGRILAYLSEEGYRTESLRDYLARDARPVNDRGEMRDDPLFMTPPYALDRSRLPAQKPLMVLFERPGCEACDAFHSDVMALKEIRELLERFEIVRLDATDAKMPVMAPDGARTTAADWFETTEFTRLPAMLFFDENGKEVQRTDALVMRQRMMNTLNFVLERAYEKGWSYQRFARSKGIERARQRAQSMQ